MLAQDYIVLCATAKCIITIDPLAALPNRVLQSTMSEYQNDSLEGQ